ncbi:MAG: nucleoside deaminase [Thermoanaerobaculia bacterium]
MEKKEEYFMKIALKEAEKAYKNGEVPVGCVIIKDGKVIGRGHNKKEKLKKATSHAEIIALERACQRSGDWRLEGCEIFITLEPCVMCAGAIKEARIKKIYFGAFDEKNGYSLYLKDFFKDEEVKGGILEKEARELLKNFFKDLRRGAGVDERDGLENR